MSSEYFHWMMIVSVLAAFVIDLFLLVDK